MYLSRRELPPWAESFLTSVERKNRRPETLRTYRAVLDNLVRDGVNLSTASPEEALAYADKLRLRLKPTTYHFRLTLLKMVLLHLNRREVADTIPYPALPDREELVKRKLLKPEEVKKLITEAPTLQHRLMFELLFETGGRRAEVNGLTIKDVQFEELLDASGHKRMTAILSLTGKSGTRTVRVFASVPDLKMQINDHPRRDDPNSPLFHTERQKSRGKVGGWTNGHFYEQVKRTAQGILKRPIHPHMFRHTRATMDSRQMTDRELMRLYGWKNPEMVAVYSHLSMRDVDEKVLMLHGFKSREQALKPIVEVRICGKCQAENAPVAVYCSKCGAVLGEERIQEVRKELEAKNKTLEDRLDRLEAISVERLVLASGSKRQIVRGKRKKE